jgi:peptidoglycan/LPS O-acetylase OafA/YrhL
MLALWCLGMVLPGLYMWLHPDGDLHPGRYTDGFWIRALKFTPPPHVPSFLFGIALADLDGMIPREARRRFVLGALGMAGLYLILYYGDKMPYPMMHDGLLMPLFALAILGLAGHNIIARIFGFAPFVIVGQASYCLYILHFNSWELIHRFQVPQRLGLARFEPWVSYLILILFAWAVMKLVEKPAQKYIRQYIR